LQSISSSGFEIIFISNSPIKPEFHSRLAIIPNCKVFERENRGNDFGAWRWAIENDLISPDTDRLLLTNDSVYGPIFSLESFFSSMKLRDDVDFWSLTDSYEGGWHLQSYFLCLSKKVFTNSSFLNVLKQDFSSLTRLEIIKKGEVQLTKSLIESGFKGEACIPYTQLEPCFEQWDAKNPTHFYWDSLIEKYNFPFIKRDLVLQNPENIQSIANLFQFIEKYSSYSIKNIKQSITEYLDSFETSNTFTEKLSVVCHLYYPGSIYYFLTKLLPLKFPQTQFIFNLSATLYYNAFFCELLKKYFPGSFILFTPNQGRDIGGKLAALDVLINSGIQSDFTLIIHDKFSPHTPTGIEWRNRLLKIISPEELSKIFRKFHQNKGAGVITTEELIKNEFDPDKDKFTCTSSAQIFSYIKRYKLNVSDYKFAAGTIFWIRTSILQKFFSVNPPLMIRKELEKGNSLDFDKGTNIHAWERLFSFIANSQGYKTIGI
jgi:lipopolysaccharide biosynthesis protein